MSDLGLTPSDYIQMPILVFIEFQSACILNRLILEIEFVYFFGCRQIFER